MNLPASTIRYLLLFQGILPFFINVLVTLALSLPQLRPTFPPQIAVWPDAAHWPGEFYAVTEILSTAFFLPLITCLIATPLVRRDVRLRLLSVLRCLIASTSEP